MTQITIAYAPDLNFVPLTLVSMASVLANAKESDEIEFVIMHSGLKEKYLNAFNELQHLKSYKLTLLKVDTAVFEGFPNANWVTAEAWFRCLLADLLPHQQKVLYLDCDTIVRASLSELFEIDLGTHYAGVIEDVSKSHRNAGRIGLQDGFYFNSGVMYINLALWRQVDFFHTLKQLVLEDFTIGNDQDALNKACDEHKLRLSPEYDYMHVWWRKNQPDYTADYMAAYEQAAENPVIVHFTGVKPNSPDCGNKFTNEFKHYAAMIPAYAPLQQEIGVKKASDRRPKLPFYKRLLWAETAADRKHLYIYFLGLKFKWQRHGHN